jgi:hypothetical protein
MPVASLFGCNPLSMGGIKKLKLASRDTNGNPLSFPLDYQLKVKDESIILLSDDEANRTIVIGGVNIQYRIVYPLASSFNEVETLARQGLYFTKNLSFDMPKLNLTTNNQLKDFLFTTGGEFAISSIVAFAVDMNDNNWIIGYDSPLILQNFDLQTDIESGENKYSLQYISNSYQRIKQFELL